MARKTEKLPQIRVTEEEKKRIYDIADKEDKSFSELVLDRILKSDVNAPSDSDLFEEKLFNLISYYEKKRAEERSPTEKFTYNNKINIIKDILFDVKRLKL